MRSGTSCADISRFHRPPAAAYRTAAYVPEGEGRSTPGAGVVALALVAAGNVWGLGKWWSGLDFVRKYPWLR
ncbi:hypothetical protein E0H45_21680 [Kribbella soli]|uniref:Uncharacterized protein n=1 Tax=Kribbella soli TaxID=1124743 RepID=A0A4R0HBV4_9ACTN|nr:hypothetical protein E0H45_21680 [Kribbella soli]